MLSDDTILIIYLILTLISLKKKFKIRIKEKKKNKTKTNYEKSEALKFLIDRNEIKYNFVNFEIFISICIRFN